MTSKNLKYINLAKNLYGKEIVNNALNITTEDIKFNRLGFRKLTSARDFMKIFYCSLKICLRGN